MGRKSRPEKRAERISGLAAAKFEDEAASQAEADRIAQYEARLAQRRTELAMERVAESGSSVWGAMTSMAKSVVSRAVSIVASASTGRAASLEAERLKRYAEIGRQDRASMELGVGKAQAQQQQQHQRCHRLPTLWVDRDSWELPVVRARVVVDSHRTVECEANVVDEVEAAVSVTGMGQQQSVAAAISRLQSNRVEAAASSPACDSIVAAAVSKPSVSQPVGDHSDSASRVTAGSINEPSAPSISVVSISQPVVDLKVDQVVVAISKQPTSSLEVVDHSESDEAVEVGRVAAAARSEGAAAVNARTVMVDLESTVESKEKLRKKLQRQKKRQQKAIENRLYRGSCG